MERRLGLLGLAVVVLGSFGCHSNQVFVRKDGYDRVKRVAIVQYAINPHVLVGTPDSQEAKAKTAEQAWDIFQKETAERQQVLPLAKTVRAPAYAAAGGKESWDGYYTADGARFFSPTAQDLEAARIRPEVAKKLCEGLGVDAVVAIYDRWSLSTYAMGFRAHSRNFYLINAFNANGERVWGADVEGVSTEGMALAGGVVATDLPTYLLNNAQAFTAALRTASTLAPAPLRD